MELPKFDRRKTYLDITQFIDNEVGTKQAVIGLSGGIDSTVTAILTADVIDKDKIFGIIMPHTSITDFRDAKQITDYLGINRIVIPIAEIYQQMLDSLPEVDNAVAQANLQARIRMSILYAYANQLEGIVVGTTNKSEAMIGYYTKHGDGGVDIEPLIGLYKTQERELARDIGTPQNIIEREPTAGLWSGQTDENELGITYNELDRILYTYERINDPRTIAEIIDSDVDQVRRVIRMVNDSEHKRTMAKGGPNVRYS